MSLICLLDEGVGFGETECHRFLYQDVLACLQRPHGQLHVQRAGRGDVHGFHVIAVDQLFPALVDPGVEISPEALPDLRADLRAGGEGYPRVL